MSVRSTSSALANTLIFLVLVLVLVLSGPSCRPFFGPNCPLTGQIYFLVICVFCFLTTGFRVCCCVDDCGCTGGGWKCVVAFDLHFFAFSRSFLALFFCNFLHRLHFSHFVLHYFLFFLHLAQISHFFAASSGGSTNSTAAVEPSSAVLHIWKHALWRGGEGVGEGARGSNNINAPWRCYYGETGGS